MRKPAFCICENKDADQLRSNCAADQRLCFRYTDSTIPLLPKSEFSSLTPSSVVVQPGLCRTLSETPKTGFLTTRLIILRIKMVFLKTERRTIRKFIEHLNESLYLGVQGFFSVLFFFVFLFVLFYLCVGGGMFCCFG